MHKKKHASGAQGVQLSLIVTPMLDMSFQLLSFFIMIYSPNALEGHLAGKLAAPPKDQAIKNKNMTEIKDDVISDTDPDLAESLIIRIEAVPPEARLMDANERANKFGDHKDGEPNQIKIVTKENTAGTLVSDERNPLADIPKRLMDELKRQVPDNTKKTNIRLDNPDGHLKYNYIIELYDACKVAGFQNISFVPPAREVK